MNRMRGICAPLLTAICALGMTAWLSPAAAQFCETRLCRDGETYTFGGEDHDGRYGVCHSSSGFGYMSHYLAHCEEGWTLDSDRGVCMRDDCTSGACGVEVPLCMPTERYEFGGTDSEGAYGSCNSGPAFFTLAKSHRPARCGEGWTLLKESGLCRRDCTTRIPIDPDKLGSLPFPVGPGVDPDRFKLRPDLVIERLWLQSALGAPLKAVEAGSAYYACFEVRNQGTFPSGAFKVRGGGLGMPTNPEQTQAGLGAGAAREGCLFYAVTPPAGHYKLGLMADADKTVAELRENNNSRAIEVEIR